MKSEFEYIELVFENCNSVRINPDDVLYLALGGINRHIFINVAHQFCKSKTADDFVLCLKNSALSLKTRFQKESEGDAEDNTSSFRHHLNVYKDITNIFIKIDNKHGEYIGIPYDTTGHGYSDENILLKVTYGDNNFTNEKDAVTISANEKNREKGISAKREETEKPFDCCDNCEVIFNPNCGRCLGV